MTPEEFERIADTLKIAYSRDRFLGNDAMMELWFDMLQDIDGELVKDAAVQYIKKNKFQPTIADIRSICEEKMDREAELRSEMREIFEFSKGVYPSSKIERKTMAYWNTLTAGKNWQIRVDKAKQLRNEVSTFIRDAEINGQINDIPTFTEYLKGLANDTRFNPRS